MKREKKLKIHYLNVNKTSFGTNTINFRIHIPVTLLSEILHDTSTETVTEIYFKACHLKGLPIVSAFLILLCSDRYRGHIYTPI